MEREVQLSPELIKSVTDKFCLEIVFILDLAGAGIREICSLDQCINLLHLNLSHNKISRIRGLNACTDLVFLDLSYNEIAKIEGLRTLTKLEKLDLSSNKITSLAGLNEVQGLTKLKCLSFQQFNLNDSNPVCRENDYRSTVFSGLPQIISLDGHRKKLVIIAKDDWAKYEINSKGIKLNMDNKPWVGNFLVKDEKYAVDDSEIKSLMRECRSILNKGDQILANVRH